MSKKKTEHILFDQLNRQKNSIPFDKMNTGGMASARSQTSARPQTAKGAFTQHRSVSRGR